MVRLLMDKEERNPRVRHPIDRVVKNLTEKHLTEHQGTSPMERLAVKLRGIRLMAKAEVASVEEAAVLIEIIQHPRRSHHLTHRKVRPMPVTQRM